MAILNKEEIQRRLEAGELLTFARRGPGGGFDVEPASYDLMAGAVVWKDPSQKEKKGEVQTRFYRPQLPYTDQHSVTVQPGEMVFVITREEVLMPKELCGTVLSKNDLALEGILALNAGHVDPGFKGPIVIRLISLRSTPWVLRLGQKVFTIFFETLRVNPGDGLAEHEPISAEETLTRVQQSAERALSNALFDLYALQMKQLLYAHYTSVLTDLQGDLAREFIRKDELVKTLVKRTWAFAVAILAVIVLVMNFIVRWSTILKLLRSSGP